jgi:hypothetical protein
MRMKGRWLMLAGALAMSLALSACDHTPEGLDDDPEVAVKKEKEQSPPPKPAVALGDPLSSLQKRADGGDVSAMVALGRAHEALGGDTHKAEAKKWYEQAAAKGDASAKEALRMMAAQAAAATRASAEEAAARTRAAAAAAAAQARASAPIPPPTTSAASMPTSAPLGAVTWQELLNCFDNSDFVTVSRPGYRKKPTDDPVFIGLTTAPDKTLTVAASGPVGEKLDAVSIVLRIRNRDNIAGNARVRQVASIANTMTRGNVQQGEIADWVGNYLMNHAKSEPVFRNGWSINISGTEGEGMQDPKKYLGEAVLIELKK